MGNFFSQQNNQPKQDKIHIEPIQENNIQPIIHPDLQPINQYVSINQLILSPLKIQPELDEEIHDELNTELDTELDEEIHDELNTELDTELDEEIHDELNTELDCNVDPIIIPVILKKEITSIIIEEDKHIDQENVNEHIIKHEQYINNKKERKRKRNNKREKTENK